MSNYRGIAINPKTDKPEWAVFLDDYFGRHQYGVQFDGETHVYRTQEVRLHPTPSDKEGGL